MQFEYGRGRSLRKAILAVSNTDYTSIGFFDRDKRFPFGKGIEVLSRTYVFPKACYGRAFP